MGLLPTALFMQLVVVVEPFGFGFGSDDTFRNLYATNETGITSFETVELANTLKDSETPWLIEFYSSWCGHCVRYSSTYKELGVRTKDWQGFFGVGALNCASELNTDICRQFNINFYPNLKLFPPKSLPSFLGQEVGPGSVEELSNDIVKWMRMLQSDQKHEEYLNISPDLRLLKPEDMDDLWTKSHFRGQKILVVVNEVAKDANRAAADSAIAKLFLDLHKWIPVGQQGIPSIRMRLIAPKDIHLLCRKFGIDEVNLDPQRSPPSVVLLNKDDSNVPSVTAKVLSRQIRDIEDILRNYLMGELKKSDIAGTRASMMVPGVNASMVSLTGSVRGSTVPAVTNVAIIKRRRYTVFVSDLENAILYSLVNELGRGLTIEGEKMEAVSRFLDVLLKYFPAQSRKRTMSFLKDLKDWLDAIRTGPQEGILDSKTFVDKVQNLRYHHAAFHDTMHTFIGCKGSQSTYGNYPCSLWSLWHSLTVGHLVMKQGEASLPGSSSNTVVDGAASEVLYAMILFVKNIFGCRECSDNFLSVATDSVKGVKALVTNDPSSEVLWLWRMHNDVNKRLSGDVTDDQAFPKGVFPSRDFCPSCYQGPDGDETFASQQVVAFLVNQYYTNIDLTGLADESDYHPKKRIGQPLGRRFGKASDGSEGLGVLFHLDMYLIMLIYVIAVIGLIFVFVRSGMRTKGPLKKLVALVSTVAFVTSIVVFASWGT